MDRGAWCCRVGHDWATNTASVRTCCAARGALVNAPWWPGWEGSSKGGTFVPKRRLLLGRKVMTNLDSMLKSRDIPLPTKVRLVKAMVFPVVMYGCESWTIKKAEHWRTDAFEQWCWRRLLRVPWTVRRSNQSILKEVSPENPLDGLTLKLKLQYFGDLMRRTDSSEKTLILGKIASGRRRGWDGWMASLTQWTWVWVNSRR